VRERDVYRQAFLESRGWKIARIWSRNWWNNPAGEVEKIKEKVEELRAAEAAHV
jgi:very-short-patch-repair endonuclease